MEELNEEEMKGVEGGACKLINPYNVVVLRKLRNKIFISKPDADVSLCEIKYENITLTRYQTKVDKNKIIVLATNGSKLLEIVILADQICIARIPYIINGQRWQDITEVKLKFSFKHGLGVATKIFKF